MKRVDTTNVQEAGEFKSLPAGAYNCIIRNAEDYPDREYLKITYDIAEGEYKGYYDEIRGKHPDWAWTGAYVKSYKTKALPMFKRFCSAVSKSNGNFIFDGNTVNADEKTLIGKRLGLVLAEEEYYTNSGDKKTRLFVNRECPVDQLAAVKVPEVKRLKESAPATAATMGSAEGFMNIPEGSTGEIPWGA